MKPIIKLRRYWQDKNQSLSSTTVLDEQMRPRFAGVTLERGWRNNEKNISCIPAGTYRVVLEWSARFNMMLWEIKGVKRRSECKFHSANYWHQLNGCIAPGRESTDINKDGYLDVTASKSALKAFHKALEGHTEAILLITTEPNIF